MFIRTEVRFNPQVSSECASRGTPGDGVQALVVNELPETISLILDFPSDADPSRHGGAEQRPDRGGHRHGQRTPKRDAHCARRDACAPGPRSQPSEKRQEQ